MKLFIGILFTLLIIFSLLRKSRHKKYFFSYQKKKSELELKNGLEDATDTYMQYIKELCDTTETKIKMLFFRIENLF